MSATFMCWSPKHLGVNFSGVWDLRDLFITRWLPWFNGSTLKTCTYFPQCHLACKLALMGEENMCSMSATFLCINLMLISTHISAGEVSAHYYHKLVINRDCVLIPAFSFHQVSTRSIIQCAIFAKSLNTSAYHYTSSLGACNVCISNSSITSFTSISSDLGYFREGK